MTSTEMIAAHEDACEKKNDMKYVHQPHWIFPVSVIAGLVMIVSGVLATYYSARAEDTDRMAINESEIAVIQAKFNGLENQILENQKTIIQLIKEGK
jgi:hypothetical protein